MTYSYNYGNNNNNSQYDNQDTNDSTNSTDNQQTNTPQYEIVDNVSTSPLRSEVVDLVDQNALNELIENATWLPGDIIRDIIFCHGGEINLSTSQEWNQENVNNDSIHQFPDCPGLEIWYRSGWNYQDYKVAPVNGYQTSDVLNVRLIKLGMPDGIDNEPNNPFRILNLPNKVVKFITAEPKKFIWVHPFLDKNPDASDAADRQGASIHRSMDVWQSGKLTNGPDNCDLYLASGFQSMPGGNNSQTGSSKASHMVYSDTNHDRKWIFVLGNSRGKDQLGYPDQPTEGREYGVVGMSGFFRSGYNVSAGTKSNTGIKFAYTMNRIDTSAGLLEANAEKLQNAIEALEEMTLIEIIEEITGGRPDWRPPSETPEAEGVGAFNLSEMEDKTGGGEGNYNEHDSKIIQDAIDKCDAISKSLKNNFSSFGFNLREIVKRGSFRKLANKTISDDLPSHTTLGILYDFTNYHINKQLGVQKEYDHKLIVSAENISNRIKKGETLTWREVINNLLTGYVIRNREATRVLDKDFDFEQIGEHLLGRNDDSDQLNLINFIRDTTREKRANKFRYVNGSLAAVLDTGFVYTADQYNKGHFGWCDACMDAGGQITNYYQHSECEYRTYDSNGEEVVTVLDRHEHDGSFGFDVYSLYDSPKPEPPSSDPRNRVATPAEPGVDILVTNYYDGRPDFTAQEWRGLYCAPAASTAAMPDWTMYDNLPTNICHTYGPFTITEMDLYYNFVVPKCDHKGPSDYGITWWFASTKDGPWVAGTGQGPTVEGYNCNKKNSTGYKSYKPKNRYMRASFWKWTGLNGKTGSPVKKEHYPPGYNYLGVDYNGQLPEGKYIDVLVTPKIKGNPYDGYEGTDPKGATYLSPIQGPDDLDDKPLDWTIGRLPDLNDLYWKKPIAHEPAGKGNQYAGQPGYYRIYGIPPQDNIYEELRTRPAPLKQKLWVSEYPEGCDIVTDGDDDWRLEWDAVTFLKGTGYENYRTFQTVRRDAQLLLGAISPDRTGEEDWGPQGEPWTITEKIDKSKWIHGPSYWGELHVNRVRPNFHDDKWQTPLNHFNLYLPGEGFNEEIYAQRPTNVRVEKGERLKISAYRGDTNIPIPIDPTQYDYDLYFVHEYDHGLDIDNFPEKTGPDDQVNFIYGGTLTKNNYNGFVVTPPSNYLILHARNTNRVKADWRNNGEPALISTSDHVNEAPEVPIESMNYQKGNRDLRRGPAYWAFGDLGSATDMRRGYRGYPDFNDAYYSFPLNDWNEVYQSIRVRKGRKYLITPGDRMIYTHRIIWGTDDRCVEANFYPNPSFGNNEINNDPHREFFHYEDDNSLLLRPNHSGASKPIEVEAQGDYLFFGAFRYDQTDDDSNNPLVDRPIKEYWSRYGEEIDVSIEEVPDITGCGFWASDNVYDGNNPQQPNWSRYDKPMMHLSTEMNEILRLDGETQSDYEDGIYENSAGVEYERVFEINASDVVDINNPPPTSQLIKYAIKKTDRTPNVDIVFRYIKREGLTQNDAYEYPIEEFVWRAGIQDETISIEFYPQSEYIQFKVYAAGKTEDRWSKKGEPLYLEMYREVKKSANDMSQYWIDWENDASYPHKYSLETTKQLKNNHWHNPLNAARPSQNGQTVPWVPGKRYKFWTEDQVFDGDKQNPNYMHVFLLGQEPRDITVPADKDFRMMGVFGNQDVPVEDRWEWHQRNNRSFNGEENGIYFTFPDTVDYNWSVVVAGAWHTGNRRTSEGGDGLTGWNPRGEALRVYWKEEPLEELQGPTYWAGYDQEGHLPNPGYGPGVHVTEYYAYPNIERGEDPTRPAGDINDYYYGDTYKLGEKNDEPNIRRGKRYRITRLQNDVYNNNLYKPDEYKLQLPHEMRMWSSNRIQQLSPSDSNFRDWIAGRYVNRKLSHFDFIADNDTIVFGAFDFYTTERGPDSWSKSGEPTNHKFESLVEMPYRGPAYFSSGKDVFPSVTDPHFYKGLNTVSVKGETYYKLKKGNNFSTAGGTFQIWYIKDDHKNNWAQMQDWAENNSNNERSWPPIPLEGTHPEDLLEYQISDNTYQLRDQVRDMFYEKGPVILFNSDSDLSFKTPKGVSKVFFGWYNRKSLDQFNRDGEVIQGIFEIEEDDRWSGKEGPLYWGGEEAVEDPPQFGNTHFEAPLRYLNVNAGGRYEVEKTSATSMQDFGQIEIYEFDPNQTPNPLDPATNNVSAQFKRIAIFDESDEKISIDVSKRGIILSATYISPRHETPEVTDWSPKGEPSPLKLKQVPQVEGPAYWGDDVHKWDPSSDYFPTFSDNKWVKPLNALSLNGDPDREDFYVELTEDINFAISVFVVEERKHLEDPIINQDKSKFYHVGTFKKRSAKKSVVDIEVPDGFKPKYAIFGVGNFEEDTRSYDDWSSRGEEVPVVIKKKTWTRGPCYPGDKNVSRNFKEFDLTEKRWRYSDAQPPKNGGKVIGGSDYQFKYKSWMEPLIPSYGPNTKSKDLRYQVVWCKSYGDSANYPFWDKPNANGRPESSDFQYEKTILDPNKRQDHEVTFRAPIGYDYVFFVVHDKGAHYTNSSGINKKYWSPEGHPCPWKYKRVHKDLHLDDIPFLKEILAALAALLAALLGFLLYFAIMAPYETLLEMVDEGPGNKYPIKRKKLGETEDDSRTYGNPYSPEYIQDDEAFYTGLNNDPIFFNYVADHIVRAWARVMRVRHNGYMFHLTNAKNTTTSGDNTKKHEFEVMNLTATHGYNYTQLNNDTLKKALHQYTEFPRNDQVVAFDQYKSGTDQYQGYTIDTSIDQNRQLTGYDIRDKWFQPSLTYSPQMGKGGFWRSYSGVQYKLASNYDNNRNTFSYPSVDGSFNNIDNIFGPRGAGLTTSVMYSSNSSNHCYALEILNGTQEDTFGYSIPNGLFTPGIEFDMKFHDLNSKPDNAANWQIVQMHLSFDIPDLLDTDTILKTVGVKVTPDSSTNYKFRNSFDNTSSNHQMKQLNKDNNLIHMRLMGDQKIPELSHFKGISACIWVGEDGVKTGRHFIISNLRPVIHYDNVVDP